jgi:hypothetical protein
MTRHPLRDSLAHSYRDELPEPYEWEPYTFHWTDVVKFVIAMPIVYLFFLSLIVLGEAL